MILVSELYILASAYRMVQMSKLCRHTDLTMHAYETLITLSFEVEVRRFMHHKRLRSLIAEAARSIRWFMSGLQYPWDDCLTRNMAHVNSLTPSTMFPSTLIDASSGPVPRFLTSVFCQEAFIQNRLKLPENLRVLLTTDHQVSWTVTVSKLSTLGCTRFIACNAYWERSQTCKKNCWRLAPNAI